MCINNKNKARYKRENDDCTLDENRWGEERKKTEFENLFTRIYQVAGA